jgi:hypothetical protein
MGLFSAVFGGGEAYKKKRQQEAAERASRGKSVLGNITGTSPYMQEWRSQKKNLVLQSKNDEKSLRKKWAYENESMYRAQDKEKERFYRKYKDQKEAERWFLKWKTEQDRRLQRERDNELKDLKYKQREDERNISRNLNNKNLAA